MFNKIPILNVNNKFNNTIKKPTSINKFRKKFQSHFMLIFDNENGIVLVHRVFEIFVSWGD